MWVSRAVMEQGARILKKLAVKSIYVGQGGGGGELCRLCTALSTGRHTGQPSFSLSWVFRWDFRISHGGINAGSKNTHQN